MPRTKGHAIEHVRAAPPNREVLKPSTLASALDPQSLRGLRLLTDGSIGLEVLSGLH